MSILDKFRTKKQEQKKPSKEESVLDMVKEPSFVPLRGTSEGKPPTSEQKEKVPQPLKRDTGRAHRILLSGHLSEKTNRLSSLDRYVFKVSKDANKIEIRKAVESVYDVHVVAVNIMINKGKFRRYGRTFGKTSDWKKAYVVLKPGEKIAGLVEGV